MKSRATPRFWQLFENLPATVKRLAVKNYQLWQENHNHPSLRFRRLEGRENLVTVRIGLLEPDLVIWTWIGSHAEYDQLTASEQSALMTMNPGNPRAAPPNLI